MMIRLLTAAAFLLHVATRGVHGAVADGDSYADFAALCNLITLAQTPVAPQADKSEALELLKTIKAINISVATADIRQALTQAQNKKWEQLSQEQTKGKEGWKTSWNDWAEAKIFAESGADKAAYAEWTTAPLSKATRHKIVYLAAQAVKTAQSLPQLQAKLTMAGAQEAAQKALLGDNKATNVLKPASTDRVTACGKASDGETADGGESAGKALLLDLLCLCGGHSSDRDVGKACCKRCNNAGNNDEWNLNTDGTARANFIASNCPQATGHKKISQRAVEQAWRHFLTRTAIAKGSGGAYRNALGVLQGAAQAGCSGHKATDGGPCVQYSNAAVVTGNKAPEWLENLRAAAQTWDEADEANSQIKQIENKLQAINNTLGSLLWQDGDGHNRQSTAPTTSKVESDTDCTNHKANSSCTDKGCKWDNKNQSEGDFCKPKEPKGQTDTAAGTGEGATGTTTNSTGSSSLVIKTSPLLLAFLLF
uniref:Variant surface glycoprotein 1125.44 n=1 Tax=Trypanosoma brucei TaxID=5691 RepID=M4T249_9TRYP|nr:variant surface glycoprotein 620 [Trypanosoma brucei]APD72595.1 variant surface glycoprotein 1125.44 [Trypanosoma brucei]